MENNQIASESSGVRLTRLINNHLLDIIRKERKNQSRIFLYGTGEYWSAFEHSAYLLSQLFPNSSTAVLSHSNYPFPVVMGSITDKELKAYGKSHIFVCDECNYKELLCSKAPSIKQYNTWYHNILKEYE